MPWNEGVKTFEAGADVEARRLVKLSSGKVVHNTVTATDDPVGVTEYAAKSGEKVAVKLINSPGTFEITAVEAIAADVEAYAAADGKIQDAPAGAGTYRRIGLALEAATGDGHRIEVLPDDYISTLTV